ncbi:MAG TPA: hypothetical protein VF258_09520, partial [Luteolibacter sp.]
SHMPISKELEQILDEQTPWNPETAKRRLAEHAELVAKIEHIATLSTRSSSNIPSDHRGFTQVRAGINGCRILLLKARLAAEAGDEAETLRLVSAAANLGSHYHDIESPSLHDETVAIPVDLNIHRATFTTLLPALGKSADLVRWKSVLGRKVYSSGEFAKVLRGEWHIGADFMVFPMLGVMKQSGGLPDAEATAHSYSFRFNQSIADIPSRSLADLMNYDFQAAGGVSHLSEEGRSIMDLNSTGYNAWPQCYANQATIQQQYQAALDLLILEKSGATLTPADASRIAHDPVSGSPFVFDAASRQISTPTGTVTSTPDPLTLPW